MGAFKHTPGCACCAYGGACGCDLCDGTIPATIRVRAYYSATDLHLSNTPTCNPLTNTWTQRFGAFPQQDDIIIRCNGGVFQLLYNRNVFNIGGPGTQYGWYDAVSLVCSPLSVAFEPISFGFIIIPPFTESTVTITLELP